MLAERCRRYSLIVGMAQRVDGSGLGNAAGQHGLAEDDLQAGSGKGAGGRRPVDAAPAASGKEPDGVAVGFPELAQQLESALGQGDITVLATLAVADVKQQAGRVDVADLQASALAETQAARIDRG